MVSIAAKVFSGNRELMIVRQEFAGTTKISLNFSFRPSNFYGANVRHKEAISKTYAKLVTTAGDAQ